MRANIVEDMQNPTDQIRHHLYSPSEFLFVQLLVLIL